MSKKKKLAYMIAAQTGRSYQGARNVMAAALGGDAEAKKIVEAAKAEIADGSRPFDWKESS